jgi:ABC-type nitrate/sulfonate/bicarbonate transport system substrate-binding protein
MKSTRRSLLARLAVAPFAGLLTGCGNWLRPPSLPQYPVRPASDAATTLTIGVPGEQALDYLPLSYLIESGVLVENGPPVRQIVTAAGPESLAALLAGRVQLALLDAPATLQAAERGVDLVGIFQLYASDSAAVFGLQRVSPGSAAGLSGGIVGLAGRTASFSGVLAATLESAGLESSAVGRVEVGEPRAQLEAGRVAALAGPNHLAAWFESRAQAVVRYPAPGWENMPGPFLVTTRALVASQRPALSGFCAALQRALVELLRDPGALRSQALARFARDAAERPALAAQFETVLASWSSYRLDRGPGWTSPERLNAAGELLTKLGLINGTADPGQVFIGDLLPPPPKGA